MKKIRLVFLFGAASLLAACTTAHKSAPVVERPLAGANRPQDGARPPAARPAAKPAADARGFYTVKKGDTLLHIALDFGQNYRDLIDWNNLENPNDIKVDQVLRVLPPDGAAGGVQTGSVASPASVEVKPLPGAPATPAPAAPHKTLPRGDKQIYSEAALAELKKPDAASGNVPGTAQAAKAEPPKAADARPAETPAAAATDDEGIAWIWPAEGKVIAGFDDTRKGIDIAGQLGQQVLAAGSGKVMYAGSGIRGYGNLVIVKHTNNMLSAYAHNKTILVKEGQTVSKGQKIAEMGNTDADAVKLHFEIRQQGKPVDPSKFLPNR